MRVTATIRSTSEGMIAECSEYDLQGVGSTVPLALEALREAIYDRVVRPQAVAPPSVAGNETIEIVVISPASEPSSSDDGPGAP